jgi:hypothetical protein
VTNVRPVNLDMTFKQAIEMIAKGGKPPSAISKPAPKKKPAKKATKAKKKP